jgi:hypothetical protein
VPNPSPIVALAVVLAAVSPAAEPAAGWQRLLDEMVARAESAPPAPEAPDPPPVSPPAELPPPVVSFQNYYRGPGRGGYEKSLRRLAEARPVILRIFEEEGIPHELIWVGLVESGYIGTAQSSAGALGVWQLMPETARRFGLRVGAGVEERVDLEKSTRAAARYLRLLYARFGDWPLALAAYNAGENRVEQALRQVARRSFWGLYDAGLLPAETRNYVPAVLAAQSLVQPGPQSSPPRPRVEFARITYAP